MKERKRARKEHCALGVAPAAAAAVGGASPMADVLTQAAWQCLCAVCVHLKNSFASCLAKK